MLFYYLWNMPLYLLFAFLWSQDIYQFYCYFSRKKRLFLLCFKQYRFDFKTICEKSMIVSVEILIIVHFLVKKFNISYASYILNGYYVLVIIIDCFKIMAKEKSNCISMLISLLKFFISLQFTIITLKWTSELNWTWQLVFLVFWSLILILTIIHLALLLGMIEGIYLYYNRKVKIGHVIGCLWFVLMMESFTVNPFIFLNYIVLKFDAHNDGSVQTFIILCVYSLIMGIYHLKFSSQVALFIQNLTGQKEEQDKNKKILRMVPRYLIKISSTFFQLPNQIHPEDQLQNNNNKQTDIPKSNILSSASSFKNVQQNMAKNNPDNNELCYICFIEQANIVFLPCKHGGICKLCAQEMLLKNSQCLLCRNQIEDLLELDITNQKNNQIEIIKVIKVNYPQQ